MTIKHNIFRNDLVKKKIITTFAVAKCVTERSCDKVAHSSIG